MENGHAVRRRRRERRDRRQTDGRIQPQLNPKEIFGIKGFGGKISPKPFSFTHMKKLFLLVFISLISVTFAVGQPDPPKTLEAKPATVAAPSNPDQQKVNTTPFRILSKVAAPYTEEARKNGVEGRVRLKVTFWASGEIGPITPLHTLPSGLTEQAVAAARKIRFTPKLVDGVPVSVIATVEYNFSLYYDEDGNEVAEKAKIIDMPDIEFPAGGLYNNLEGKLPVTIILDSSGSASVETLHVKVSKNIELLVRDAVAKIVFEPAKSADGKNISVARKIIYELKSKK
jgi:TonB family protein